MSHTSCSFVSYSRGGHTVLSIFLESNTYIAYHFSCNEIIVSSDERYLLIFRGREIKICWGISVPYLLFICVIFKGRTYCTEYFLRIKYYIAYHFSCNEIIVSNDERYLLIFRGREMLSHLGKVIMQCFAIINRKPCCQSKACGLLVQL